MKLVVGLGNIGKRYTHTRHNIGFMVVEELARQLQARTIEEYNSGRIGHIAVPASYPDWKIDAKLKAEVAKFELESGEIILAKPQTMMNGSGEAVQKLMQKYRVALTDLWVIYDDVDVDFGKLRLRVGATSGQQGIRSITATIGSQFVHARMGISLNDRNVEPSEVYVLKPFNETEQSGLSQIINEGARTLLDDLASDKTRERTVDLTA